MAAENETAVLRWCSQAQAEMAVQKQDNGGAV